MKLKLLLLVVFNMFLVGNLLAQVDDPGQELDVSTLVKTRRQIRQMTRAFSHNYRRSGDKTSFGEANLYIPTDSVNALEKHLPNPLGAGITGGLRIYYGLDNTNNIVLLFKLATLEKIIQVDKVDSFNIKELDPFFMYQNAWIPVMPDDANGLMKNYMVGVQKNYPVTGWGPIVINDMLNEASDPRGITLPWVEIDSLIGDNSAELLRKKRNRKLLRRWASENKEISGINYSKDYLNDKNTRALAGYGWRIKQVEFRSIAEIEPKSGTYRHSIALYPNLSILPGSIRKGIFTGAAANMGHLCPPKCETIGIAAK